MLGKEGQITKNVLLEWSKMVVFKASLLVITVHNSCLHNPQPPPYLTHVSRKAPACLSRVDNEVYNLHSRSSLRKDCVRGTWVA